jgi:FHA domain
LIEMDERSFVLKDLGSETGTYLNGRRVTQAALHHRDIIRFGAYRFVFQESDADADDRSAEETAKIDFPSIQRSRTSGPLRGVIASGEARPRSLNTKETAPLTPAPSGHFSGPMRATRREPRPQEAEPLDSPTGEHFARVSLLCGLAGIVAFLPAIYFGHNAAPQTPRGRTQRLLGLALGYGWFLAWAGFALYWFLIR